MANFTKEQLQNQITQELMRSGIAEGVARSAAIQGIENYAPGQSIKDRIEWAKKFVKSVKHMPDKPEKKQPRGRR